MNAVSVGFVCPACKGALAEERDGLCCSACGEQFPYLMPGAIPDLTFPKQLARETARHRQHFDDLSERYNDSIARLLQSNEAVFRRTLVQLLKLKPRSHVLEVGVGTGSNLSYIFEFAEGVMVDGIDLSPRMVGLCARHHLAQRQGLRLAVANAEHLPYPDEVFDAVLHFGFINEFGSPARGIAEMVRVVKPGGRVVISDDGIPPYLRGLPWAKALISVNPSFGFDPPLDLLPASIANLEVRWFANVFYIISFSKTSSNSGGGGHL